MFADSICASEAFTQSFRQEMAALFPDRPMQLIPRDRPPVYPRLRRLRHHAGKAARSGGTRCQRAAAATLHEVPPHLEAVKIGDQYAVIFSPFDLSCALEKQDSLECQGYTREDAARIGLNVVLTRLRNSGADSRQARPARICGWCLPGRM